MSPRLTLIIKLCFAILTCFITPSAYSDSLKELIEKAQDNDVSSQYLLAQYYQFGKKYELGKEYESDKKLELGTGISVDLPEALYWYSQAAENGLPQAQLQLAHFYAEGIGTTQNINQAIRWYSLLVYQGNPTAPLKLAQLYEAHSTDFSSLDLAEVWYQIALISTPQAEEGYNRVLEAQFNRKRAQQLSSIEQLDTAYSNDHDNDPNAANTQTNPTTPNHAPGDQWLTQTQWIIAVLFVFSAVGIVAFAKRKANKKAATHQQKYTKDHEQQIKAHVFTIRQQKRQMEAMYNEIKKYKELKNTQINKDKQRLQVACAMFGYTTSSIPNTKTIKVRYKQLSKLYHPDTHGSDEEMKRLNGSLKVILQNVTKS